MQKKYARYDRIGAKPHGCPGDRCWFRRRTNSIATKKTSTWGRAPLRPSQTIGKSGFFTIRKDGKTMEDGDLTKELGFISGSVLDNACF